MSDSALNSLITSATVGDKVDLKKICDILSIQVKADASMVDLCRIGIDEERKPIIWVNPKVDAKTRFTLIAIAVAEFILHPERISGLGINYDMFSLSDIHRKKHTPYIMLATRLAIPEHIIEKITQAAENEFECKRVRESNGNFDIDTYIEKSIYLPEFIRSVVRESSGKLLLDNLIIK